MLASAKQNLEKFAFFGITEHMEESGILFEKRLATKFGKPMKQLPFSALCSAPVYELKTCIKKLPMSTN